MKCFLCAKEFPQSKWTEHFQIEHTEPPAENAQRIAEESGEHKVFYEQAEHVTIESLSSFVRHLSTAYHHDYGTVCHAVAACAIAAAKAFNRGPSGGITGFQAGAVFWQFAQHWLPLYGPARLLRFENLLFPQYADGFEKRITPDAWQWLQAEAKKKLQENLGAHPSVVTHWQSILNGLVPFGFQVSEDA